MALSPTVALKMSDENRLKLVDKLESDIDARLQTHYAKDQSVTVVIGNQDDVTHEMRNILQSRFEKAGWLTDIRVNINTVVAHLRNRADVNELLRAA